LFHHLEGESPACVFLATSAKMLQKSA